MGLNGVDNAKLSFHNVRVPRENLLNKHSDVDEKVCAQLLIPLTLEARMDFMKKKNSNRATSRPLCLVVALVSSQ